MTDKKDKYDRIIPDLDLDLDISKTYLNENNSEEQKSYAEDIIENSDMVDELHIPDKYTRETLNNSNPSAREIAVLGHSAWKSDGEITRLGLNLDAYTSLGSIPVYSGAKSALEPLADHGLIAETDTVENKFQTGSRETLLDPDTPYERQVVSGSDELEDPTEAFLRLGVVQAHETDIMNPYEAEMILAEYQDSKKQSQYNLDLKEPSEDYFELDN